MAHDISTQGTNRQGTGRQDTGRQAARDLLGAQMRLFEEAARAAGLTDMAREAALRRAFGPHQTTLAAWRSFAAGRGAPPVASPDLLRRIGHLTFRLIVEAEVAEMTA